MIDPEVRTLTLVDGAEAGGIEYSDTCAGPDGPFDAKLLAASSAGHSGGTGTAAGPGFAASPARIPR